MKLTGLCLIPFALLACQLPHVSAGEENLESVYERVHKSVVTIQTVGKTSTLDRQGEVVMASGIGSGVVISNDGRIMTAAHVVQTAEAMQVQFVSGEVREARVLGTVPLADLALIQVIGDLPLTAAIAPLADSDKARVGSSVFVIGSPRGITHTLTAGYLSAHRPLEVPLIGASTIDLIQTDAAINKGNSGGPLFNMQGEVLGIVSHIVSESGGSEGLGFAIASNAARRLLLERGVFWSGIESVTLSGIFARAFNLPEGKSGALVQAVANGSMGARIGLLGGTITATLEGQKVLLGGDILLDVMGIDVANPAIYALFQDKLSKLDPDGEVSITILRAGATVQLSKKLSALIDSK